MLQGEHSAILLTFIKLPFVIKVFGVSIFEWPFYTDFTVHANYQSLTLILTFNILPIIQDMPFSAKLRMDQFEVFC